MSSPLPMVTEAITAPGPKNRNHCSGFLEMRALGTGTGLVSLIFIFGLARPRVRSLE